MRVKLLLNLGAKWGALQADETYDVDDTFGAMLLGRGWAVQVPEAEQPVTDKFDEMREHPQHTKRSRRVESAR